MPSNPKADTKPAKTFKSVWPANIFANSRTDKLIGLERYEMISIGINNGNMYHGNPGITKKLKNLMPCLTNPKTVTNINTPKAKAKVTITWLVKVKL